MNQYRANPGLGFRTVHGLVRQRLAAFFGDKSNSLDALRMQR